MGLIPKSKSGTVAFYQSKIAPWQTNAVAIGTSAPEVTALDARLTAAQSAIAAQVAAKAAAETATATADEAVRLLEQAGADIIRQIRAKGAIVGASVYALAQIPAPAFPSNRPAPGKPSGFKATLGEDGSLLLKWKCSNPAGTSGTMYQVWRKVDGGEFTYCGGCGAKEYVDGTIPVGTGNVTYQLQAVRSTAVGPWAQYNVNFGTGGSATVTETKPAKIAA
jgi:hypothetical protein